MTLECWHFPLCWTFALLCSQKLFGRAEMAVKERAQSSLGTSISVLQAEPKPVSVSGSASWKGQDVLGCNSLAIAFYIFAGQWLIISAWKVNFPLLHLHSIAAGPLFSLSSRQHSRTWKLQGLLFSYSLSLMSVYLEGSHFLIPILTFTAMIGCSLLWFLGVSNYNWSPKFSTVPSFPPIAD